MSKLKVFGAAVVLGLCCAVNVAMAGESKTVVIRAGDGGMSPDSSGVVQPHYFANKVSDLSGGRIKVEVFDHAVLGDEVQMVQQIQEGTLQMDFISTGNLTTRVPELSVFAMPYMFGNFKDGYRLQDKGWDAINNWSIKHAGLRVIAQECMGFRALFNTKRPINSPQDMKGMIWRAVPDPVDIATWKAWGVAATAVPWTEAFNALSQGVINGGANPFDDIVTARFYEVAHYITPIHASLLCHVLVIGQPFFASLSKQDQDILVTAGRDATKYIRAWTVDHQQHQLKFLEKYKGMHINKPSDEADFRRLTVNTWPSFYKTVGAGDADRGSQIVNEAAAIVKGERAAFSPKVLLH